MVNSMPTDPVELVIAEALERKGVSFERLQHDGALDFYLPTFGVHIECKRFHTPRISEQMARHSDVIAIQGLVAAQTFAALIASMTVYYDVQSDAAHIALLGGIGPGEVVRNARACDGQVVLDFNAAGQLVGIELLDLDMLHPDLARDAIQMRPIREGDL